MVRMTIFPANFYFAFKSAGRASHHNALFPADLSRPVHLSSTNVSGIDTGSVAIERLVAMMSDGSDTS